MRAPMVSATQQTQRIRQRKARTSGSRRKRFERANGTPKFPIHPAGYDQNAPDALRAAPSDGTQAKK
ncbi:hypothetical protein SOCEGT47_078990 [Sorangium cellulosum]|uniref:Uncharacterized protein n=2 Tax=Polyangiaceae TaxID=49 RepID=A0A4V0NET7_SORCE|nr:hypothetical protein SOCEGT47_078990 [Sorangium cellulosum]